jgi:hypothetical protein
LFVIERRQGKLLQLIDALRPPRGFSRCLDSGQKQSDEDADNCDHDQKLNQGETM